MGLRKALERQHEINVKLDVEREEYVKLTLIGYLRDMKLNPDSEVGRFVLDEFRPVFSVEMDVEETYGCDAIFTFLTNFADEDVQA